MTKLFLQRSVFQGEVGGGGQLPPRVSERVIAIVFSWETPVDPILRICSNYNLVKQFECQCLPPFKKYAKTRLT